MLNFVGNLFALVFSSKLRTDSDTAGIYGTPGRMEATGVQFPRNAYSRSWMKWRRVLHSAAAARCRDVQSMNGWVDTSVDKKDTDTRLTVTQNAHQILASCL